MATQTTSKAVPAPELYGFQASAVEELSKPHKHIVISGTGCLAKGTPVRLADGTTKPVEQLKAGDMLLAYDQDTNTLVPNEVGSVIRTSHNPKPMLELDYDGEKITTTYDHYYWGGDGFYPLYQLVWGALEASQRVQLKLLCEQYGQALDHETVWCKHSSSNEASPRCQWLFANADGRENSETAQSYRANLVSQPVEIARGKPYQRQAGRQPSGELGVVLDKIQCLGWTSPWEDTTSNWCEQPQSHSRTTTAGAGVFSSTHDAAKLCPKNSPLRQVAGDVPKCDEGHDNEVGKWKISVKVSEPYYTISMRTAPYSYCIGRRHYYLTHNSGKSAMSLRWAMTTPNSKWLVVTTPAARDSGQWYQELEMWVKSRSSISLEVVSWAGLAKWTMAHWKQIDQYTFIFDEIRRAAAGVSSAQGTAFLQIAKRTPHWAGFTATPGDRWIDFQAYFVAAGYVRNKTQFMQEFCQVQTFKGFPEIVGYHSEDLLRRWWKELTVCPDTSQMLAELPPESHWTHNFAPSPQYRRIAKTRTLDDGTFLDTAGAYCAALRRACFTKEKQQWLSDYLHDLGRPTVLFYALTETGDQICKLAKKALPRGSRVWRVSGGVHEIPTAKTIGKTDVVVCQWQAGSEALNLQFIDQWVGVEMCYSYSVAIQARGRIKRIGQQSKHLDFHYLKCTNSIEEAVYECLKKKGDFAESVWMLNDDLKQGK